MKTLTTTVARIIYGMPFIVFGLFHLMNGDAMTGVVPGWMPGALFFVYLTGLALIAAGISIIGGVKAKLASLLLAVLLLIFILTVHLPNIGNQMSMISLLKDMALMGGALTYAGIFAKEESGYGD